MKAKEKYTLKDFVNFLNFVYNEEIFSISTEKYPIDNLKLNLEKDLITTIKDIIIENKKAKEIKEQLREIELEKDINLKIIKKMLPVIDSLERLIQWGETYAKNSEELQNWIIAIKGIHKRIIISLKDFGLEEIDPTGQKVDLSTHEVIQYQPTYDYPEGTVIETKRKGYKYRGKILREAQVIVANNLNKKGEW